jgi:DNA-binding response OmpR family regulator
MFLFSNGCVCGWKRLPNTLQSVVALAQADVVLVVEDDLATRRLFRTALKTEGYAVVTVGDGLDALKYLEMHTPAAVILDLGLPRLHGSDVLSEMAAQGLTERTPVIVVTGEQTDYLDASQFVCVLQKPLNPDRLVATVRRCLSRPPGAQGI